MDDVISIHVRVCRGKFFSLRFCLVVVILSELSRRVFARGRDGCTKLLFHAKQFRHVRKKERRDWRHALGERAESRRNPLTTASRWRVEDTFVRLIQTLSTTG